MSDQRYRVVNKCKYDIGVKTSANIDVVIRAGSFQMLTADDIFYIESICRVTKFFAKKMLVPLNQNNEVVPWEELGVVMDEDPNPHLDDTQIAEKLSMSAKKIEEWLSGITDPAELHAIAEVAKGMELTSTKIKVLQEKMPDAVLINE